MVGKNNIEKFKFYDVIFNILRGFPFVGKALFVFYKNNIRASYIIKFKFHHFFKNIADVKFFDDDNNYYILGVCTGKQIRGKKVCQKMI